MAERVKRIIRILYPPEVLSQISASVMRFPVAKENFHDVRMR